MYVCRIKQKTEGQGFHDSIALEFERLTDMGIYLDTLVSRYPANTEFSAEIENKKEEE